MAQCPWCDKSLLGEDIYPSCSFCILNRATDAVPMSEEEKETNNFDLSYLEDESEDKRSKSKNYLQVQKALYEMQHKEMPKQQDINDVVMLKVKSNYLRSKSHLEDGLILHFDENGIAEVPAHERSKIEWLSRVRPGRFFIVEEEKPEISEESPNKVSKSEVEKEEKPEAKVSEVSEVSEKPVSIADVLEKKTSKSSISRKTASTKKKKTTKKKSSRKKSSTKKKASK